MTERPNSYSWKVSAQAPEMSAEGVSDRGNPVLFREHKLKKSSLGQDACQVTNQLPPSTVSDRKSVV